jgi:hypothetical protein
MWEARVGRAQSEANDGQKIQKKLGVAQEVEYLPSKHKAKFPLLPKI